MSSGWCIALVVALASAACDSSTHDGHAEHDGGHEEGNHDGDATIARKSGDERGDGGSHFNDGGQRALPTGDSGQKDADATPGVPEVRGHLLVGTGLAIDSDTADPRRPLVSNDTFATAQLAQNFGVVGGYLGSVATGIDGMDVYRVDLDSFENVSLYLGASPETAKTDFGLSLYDAKGNLVDDSLGTGPVERVTSPNVGTYFVKVESPATEIGLYGLSFGGPELSAAFVHGLREKLSSRYEFVPGEALIELESSATSPSEVLSKLGLRSLRAPRGSSRYHRVSLAGGGSQGIFSRDRRETIRTISALRRQREVVWVEPNYVRRLQALPPNDSLYSSQWDLDAIHVQDAWDHSKGAGAIVAVIDTGVKRVHPDFVNADSTSQLLPGYDMISDPKTAADGDGRDANPDDPGDLELGTDSSWHGTHMAGIVAAATNNAQGCAGVAPEAKILPVRAFGVGGGTTDDLVQGILYAAGLDNETGSLPSRRADVINLSVSGRGLSRITAEAVAAARSAGVIVVAAAGNDSADVAGYSPAGEAGVVSVGATDASRRLAYYSNSGSRLDLVAPGGDMTADSNSDGVKDGVWSLVYANGGTDLYLPHDGTSPATAHIAGVIALMKSAYPALTPARFDAMLADSANPITDDLGPAGRDAFFGYGLIDAKLAVLAAVNAASAPAPNVPTLSLSTTTLDFGSLVSHLPLRLDNTGVGTLVVDGISSDSPWIGISPGSLGENTVTIDRSQLPLGAATGTIQVHTNGGSAIVTVTAQGLPQNSGGDVGELIVRLLDTQARVVAETRTTADTGYAFDFPGLKPGTYTVVAGTDLDGDGVLGANGEVFGAYPPVSGPTTLVVTEIMTDVSFPVDLTFHK